MVTPYSNDNENFILKAFNINFRTYIFGWTKPMSYLCRRKHMRLWHTPTIIYHTHTIQHSVMTRHRRLQNVTEHDGPPAGGADI